MIYNYRNKGFIEVYKENSKIRKLIKNRIFYVEKDNCNLVVKITHLKSQDKWGSAIDVNIKVSGCIINYWGNKIDVKTGYFYSSVRRNRDIRYKVESEIRNFMKLFGVSGYNVDISKVMVCDKV